MNATMTEERKKPKDDKNQPKRVRPGVAINVYIDPDLAAIMESYLDGLDPKITKTALIESLLRGFFRQKGLWPPAK